MSACCQAAAGAKTRGWARSLREMIAWVVPGAVLVLVPKCPMCLAAYVALWTGIGLSLSTTNYLRWGLLFVSVSALLFLSIKRLDRTGAFRYFRKETESCNTK